MHFTGFRTCQAHPGIAFRVSGNDRWGTNGGEAAGAAKSWEVAGAVMVLLNRDDFYGICLFPGSSDFISYPEASPGENLSSWEVTVRRGAAWEGRRPRLRGQNQSC